MKRKPHLMIKQNLLLAFLTLACLWPIVQLQAVQLVNEWKFEGNALDTSGNGNNGTIYNNGSPAPAYAPGVFGGQGIYLNPNNYIQCPVFLGSPVNPGYPSSPNGEGVPWAGTSSWSENVWLYLTNAPGSLAGFAGFGATTSAAGQSRTLIAFGNPSSQGIYSWGNGSDVASGVAFPLNQWIMITITHDGTTGTRSIFLDGTNLISAVAALNNIPGSRWFITAGWKTPWTGKWNGIMDEFTIWNGVLNASQIAGLYASNNIGTAPNITLAPRSGSAYVGEKYTLNARADTACAYQWVKNATNVLTMLDPTNTTLVLSLNSTADAGTYSVVISNAAGTATSSCTVSVMNTNHVADGLIAYWNFDSTSGTNLVDISGHGNDGILINFPTDDSEWIPGQIGRALYFRGPGTGLNDYIQVTNNQVNPTRAMTVSAWVWVDSISQWATIIKNWPGASAFSAPYTNSQIHLGMQSTDGDLSCFTFNPDTASQIGPVREGAAMPLGRWLHVAYVCDGQMMRLYRNGAAIGTPLAYGGWLNPSTLTNTLGIGVKLFSTGLPSTDPAQAGYWKGKMDDLGIWNRGLNPGEILAIYLAGLSNAPLNSPIVDTLTHQQLPVITQQPQPVTRYQNEYNAQFNVLAIGAGTLSYQWRQNGANMSNETNHILNVPGPFTTSATYDVVVTDTRPGSTSSVTSSPGYLNVQTVASPVTALAGYWTFDETSGTTAADSTANARNATLLNCPGDSTTWVTGKIGGALALGGPATAQYAIVNNYVQASNSTLSISAWVQADALNGSDAIVDTFGQTVIPPNGQYRLGMSSSSALSGSVAVQAANGVTATDTSAFPTGSWQHVAVVADGATVRLFRNGAQVASNAYSNSIPVPMLITNMLIGARIADDGANFDPTNACFWTGKMDDLGIWTRGLSPQEVYQVFAAGWNGHSITQSPGYPNPPPLIMAQPQNESIYLDEPFWPALSVAASYSSPLSYQWWKDGAVIANATNSTYSKSGTVSFADTGSYSVVLSAGSLSVTSGTAVVSVIAPAPQLDDGMVLYLKLDETSGITAADSTTNANNGALVNFTDPSTNWLAGVINGGLQFNVGGDLNDVVQVPYQSYLDFGSGSFSVSLWAKAASGVTQTSYTGLLCLGAGNGWESYGLDDYHNAYRFFVRDSSRTARAVSSGIAPSGNWQHLAAIYDTTAGRMAIYVNGVLCATNPTFASLYTQMSAPPLDVGARDDGTGAGFWPFQGMLDDVRVYGRALTPIEVRALAYQGLPPSLAITSGGGRAVVSWPVEAFSVYELQASPAFDGTWTNVLGVVTNSVTLTPSGEVLFFRLHRK